MLGAFIMSQTHNVHLASHTRMGRVAYADTHYTIYMCMFILGSCLHSCMHPVPVHIGTKLKMVKRMCHSSSR